jgi:heme exporter protein A
MQSGQASLPHISLDNVAILRGNRLVLQRFSMHANAGDIIWIRGANGCGKSTLLRVIAGLLPVTAGQASIGGTIALADENCGLDVNQPLEKALSFWAGMDGANGESRHTALQAMDLIGLVDVPVRYLSSGQRRRAALSRVIASGAPIWLLDEPYNGLDSANMARLDTALLRHGAAGGIALVAAHQPPSINVAQSIALDQVQAESKAA